MTATGTGGDEVVHLMLGEANLLEHGAIQVGMSLAVESDMRVIEGIVEAAIVPWPVRCQAPGEKDVPQDSNC